jgi:hypothetical protein
MSDGSTDRTPLDDQLLTLTLPAYKWAILRGAARGAARRDLRRSGQRQRDLPGDGTDLNVFRAQALEDAAAKIERALLAAGWKPC